MSTLTLVPKIINKGSHSIAVDAEAMHIQSIRPGSNTEQELIYFHTQNQCACATIRANNPACPDASPEDAGNLDTTNRWTKKRYPYSDKRKHTDGIPHFVASAGGSMMGNCGSNRTLGLDMWLGQVCIVTARRLEEQRDK